MLDRLLGLETEYAIRFTPAAHYEGEPPSRAFLYRALIAAVRRLVTASPGRVLRDEIFTQNGGGFRYEYGPAGSGLIEGGTPECRGPSAALLYQRAQDDLLAEATRDAEAILASLGYPGSLGLLKNCRDAAGNVYGAQENYDAVFADGWRLQLWRIGVALLTGPALIAGAAMWLMFAVFTLGLLVSSAGFVVAASVIRPLRRTRTYERLQSDDIRVPLERVFERALNAISIAIMSPFAVAMRAMVGGLGFRRARRWLEPLLISRPIISGAGSLDADGSFLLSEKATAIHRRIGATTTGRDRGIVDVGNLIKRLVALPLGDWRSYAGLYRSRQRLQLGLSDSNMAEVAEYLRIATTTLVIDMAESEVMANVEPPQLRRPLATLAAINGDLSLAEALAIQRRYVELAAELVAGSDTPSMEAAELVRCWREVLDDLESNRDALFGQLDWVTKKSLVDRAAADGPAAQKKIDLKYHELGSGYFAELDRRELMARLVSAEDIRAARLDPPDQSPAAQRSYLMRLHPEGRVSWDKVRVRGWLNNTVGGQVIEIDRYRD
jgi:proteasome accessory factor A